MKFDAKYTTYIAIAVVGALVLLIVAFLFGRDRGANEVGIGRGASKAEMYGGWALMCAKTQKDERRCVLSLRVAAKSRKNLLFSLSVVRDAKGAPVLVMATPPSVGLAAGIQLTVGKRLPAKVAYDICVPKGCEGSMALDEGMKGALSSAEAATVQFTSANGQQIRFQVPLKGFADGYSAWQSK